MTSVRASLSGVFRTFDASSAAFEFRSRHTRSSHLARRGGRVARRPGSCGLLAARCAMSRRLGFRDSRSRGALTTAFWSCVAELETARGASSHSSRRASLAELAKDVPSGKKREHRRWQRRCPSSALPQPPGFRRPPGLPAHSASCTRAGCRQGPVWPSSSSLLARKSVTTHNPEMTSSGGR